MKHSFLCLIYHSKNDFTYPVKQSLIDITCYTQRRIEKGLLNDKVQLLNMVQPAGQVKSLFHDIW